MAGFAITDPIIAIAVVDAARHALPVDGVADHAGLAAIAVLDTLRRQVDGIRIAAADVGVTTGVVVATTVLIKRRVVAVDAGVAVDVIQRTLGASQGQGDHQNDDRGDSKQIKRQGYSIIHRGFHRKSICQWRPL
jgi:hypothetical protein